jgi:hypothetical protein
MDGNLWSWIEHGNMVERDLFSTCPPSEHKPGEIEGAEMFGILENKNDYTTGTQIKHYCIQPCRENHKT